MTDTTTFTFDFGGIQLRAVMLDGQPWFIAADVCRALGLRPNSQGSLGEMSEDELVLRAVSILQAKVGRLAQERDDARAEAARVAAKEAEQRATRWPGADRRCQGRGRLVPPKNCERPLIYGGAPNTPRGPLNERA